jgi:hypothetical protein
MMEHYGHRNGKVAQQRRQRHLGRFRTQLSTQPSYASTWSGCASSRCLIVHPHAPVAASIARRAGRPCKGLHGG